MGFPEVASALQLSTETKYVFIMSLSLVQADPLCIVNSILLGYLVLSTQFSTEPEQRERGASPTQSSTVTRNGRFLKQE